MFGSIVPVEVSCFWRLTPPTMEIGVSLHHPELLPSFQLLHWRVEITAHVNAPLPPPRSSDESKLHEGDSSGKPAAATIPRPQPPSSKHAWQDGDGRLGTGRVSQESRHLGNVPHVRVERRTTKMPEKIIPLRRRHHLTAKASRNMIFRNGGGNLRQLS
ncbi:hypothetical protein B0T18DRAFT_188216 [Schizothecium vesticola]|uniref:Uncharacterized protein n=1 Tax=Schizothecium vesticola TaxID=314040 RepID=A0AA40K2U8_9PEZI|nr:hypothetical protein B0T18DRAFT_188216 [Schizothecium vesticola]